MQMACTFDRKQHMIIDPEFMDWVRRQLPNDHERSKYFCYFHKIWKTFVIARWISKGLGLFSDAMNLGHSLGNFNRGMAAEFRRRFYAPLTAKAMATAINQNDRDFTSKRADDNERYKEEAIKRREVWDD